VRYELAVEQSVSVYKVASCFPLLAKGDVFLSLFPFYVGNPGEARPLPLPYDQVFLVQPGP